LDFLIGYFRITGFDKIAEHLSGITHVRILVGINADKPTYDATQLIEKFANEQIAFCDEVCQNFLSMRELIANKKISIRISPNKDVHSKMYIFRDEAIEDYTGMGTKYQGSVIIGSSNLTHNGLEGNFELNTEIEDSHYVKDAVEVFERLWANSVELTEEDYDTYIKPRLKEPLQNEHPQTYNNIFYHVLAEYFKDIIDNQLNLDGEIQLFDYQKDAVNSAILRLNRFNGAILGDVVGLGKTVIAAGVLKVLDYKSLIIAPPAIHNQWIDTLKKFGIPPTQYKLSTYDKLPGHSDAQIIILDESHKLKNHKSERYKRIEELCKMPFRKKVLLVSATIQNNTPEDIANQIYLFQDKNGSNLPHLVSLEKFFSPLISSHRNLKKIFDKNEVNLELERIATEIKTQVLNPLLIRRTRTDIESHPMYQNDIKKFPKVEKLNLLEYRLGELSSDFTTTIEYLENKLKYERFRVLNNLNEKGKGRYKEEHPTISDNIFNDNDLSTLAKYSLIKRFESSLYAFKISLENSIVALSQFIEDLENNKLYVGKNSADVLGRNTNERRKYIYEGDKIYYVKVTKEEEEKIYLKGIVLGQDDFKNPQEYLYDLKRDLSYLQELLEIWRENTGDPKHDTFLDVLRYSDSEKMVVFTEYSDTLDYLESNMPSSLKSQTLFISSANRKEYEEIIAENFDANHENPKDNYRIIITTDTLAEGVNLHRSDTLINYDLPWNSTKLMQRMGRINRIGSKFETLDISSFKPVDESNQVIGLMEKSFIKLQSFHYTLGEDSKILFDDEVVESFGVREDSDEELRYLQLIRTFKESHPKEFEELTHIHEGAVSLMGDEACELAFFKVGSISYFYQKLEALWEGIDFLTLIKSIETSKEAVAIQSNIDACIDYHIMKMNTKIFTNNDLKNKLSKQDKEAIMLLQKWYINDKIIDKKLFENAREMVEAKSIQGLGAKILEISNSGDIAQTLTALTASSATQTKVIDHADITTKIYIKKGTK